MKYIITTDCRIKGEVFKRGTEIELDPNKADDLTTIGLLNHAGRIVEKGGDQHKRLQEEIKSDEAKAAKSK